MVDGVDEIPDEDAAIRKAIIRDVLPIGVSGFRFVFSADARNIESLVGRGITIKSFPLPVFSLDESGRYLEDLRLPAVDVNAIHRMCGGVPGNLASTRRILLSGVALGHILAEVERLPNFIALEWNRAQPKNDAERELLAAVAFGGKAFSSETLSQLLRRSASSVSEFVAQCNLLSVDEASGEIAFVSEAHRQYASHQLSGLRESINPDPKITQAPRAWATCS